MECVSLYFVLTILPHSLSKLWNLSALNSSPTSSCDSTLFYCKFHLTLSKVILEMTSLSLLIQQSSFSLSLSLFTSSAYTLLVYKSLSELSNAFLPSIPRFLCLFPNDFRSICATVGPVRHRLAFLADSQHDR